MQSSDKIWTWNGQAENQMREIGMMTGIGLNEMKKKNSSNLYYSVLITSVHSFGHFKMKGHLLATWCKHCRWIVTIFNCSQCWKTKREKRKLRDWKTKSVTHQSSSIEVEIEVHIIFQHGICKSETLTNTHTYMHTKVNRIVQCLSFHLYRMRLK